MSRLQHFPIMLFASVMGLGGFVIAYELLGSVFGLPYFVFEILRCGVTGIFALILCFYIFKMLKFPSSFKAEISHPIKINFFATIPISSLLLAIIWKGSAIYLPLYYFGVGLLSFLTLYTISFWIRNNILIIHSNPAWFIPIVGNLIVIIAADGVSGYLWYFFSVGLFFYIVLFSIIFYRILFHDQLANKFIPTLFIMIAPPAVAFLGYMKLTGGFDPFAHILLSLTIFFMLLIIFMFREFFGLKFFLSWWAFTFPLAAATIAFLRAYEVLSENFFLYFGLFSFVLLSVIICVVVYFTIRAIIRGEICVSE